MSSILSAPVAALPAGPFFPPAWFIA